MSLDGSIMKLHLGTIGHSDLKTLLEATSSEQASSQSPERSASAQISCRARICSAQPLGKPATARSSGTKRRSETRILLDLFRGEVATHRLHRSISLADCGHIYTIRSAPVSMLFTLQGLPSGLVGPGPSMPPTAIFAESRFEVRCASMKRLGFGGKAGRCCGCDSGAEMGQSQHVGNVQRGGSIMRRDANNRSELRVRQLVLGSGCQLQEDGSSILARNHVGREFRTTNE